MMMTGSRKITIFFENHCSLENSFFCKLLSHEKKIFSQCKKRTGPEIEKNTEKRRKYFLFASKKG
jgi:hypothetical protein